MFAEDLGAEGEEGVGAKVVGASERLVIEAEVDSVLITIEDVPSAVIAILGGEVAIELNEAGGNVAGVGEAGEGLGVFAAEGVAPEVEWAKGSLAKVEPVPAW